MTPFERLLRTLPVIGLDKDGRAAEHQTMYCMQQNDG